MNLDSSSTASRRAGPVHPESSRGTGEPRGPGARVVIKTLIVLFSVALAGCNTVTKPYPVPLPGKILSFTGAPAELAAAGDKATLKWETSDATAISLEQVGKGPVAIDATAAKGSVEVMLAKDAVFVLTARGEGGTDSSSAAVRVKGGSQGVVFDAVPRSVSPGGAATLVWTAPGSTSVTLKEAGGATLDLGGQLESGSVRVQPAKTTTYELDANGKKLSVTVDVGIAIGRFEPVGAAPLPGQMLSLAWETSGGTRLTLLREGAAAPLRTETTPSAIVSGTFTELVPATTPVDGVLRYTLELEQGTVKLSRALTVRVGGSVKIDQLLVPPFVRSATPFVVQWKTTGAERLELWVDGALVFLAPDAAVAAQSNRAVLSPVSGAIKIRLVASNTRGAVAERELTATVVAPPVFNTFTADKPAIAAGGEKVLLSWNVTNARHVRITESGQTVFDGTGVLDMSSAPVFPNRSTATYVLEADNATGEMIAPKSVSVTVTSPGVLTFNTKVPVGGTASITGHTISGGTTLLGLPNVKQNAAGDAFVDIAATGNVIQLVSTDTTATVVDIGPFTTRIFGRAVSGSTISVSPDGYLVFSATAQTGPTSPTTTAIGTQLFPLTLAPMLKDLVQANGKVSWQLDSVADEQRLIVQWTEVQPFTQTPKATFQLQVFTRGKVVFAYKTVPAAFGAFASGVVNSTESDVLAPPAPPIEGDVFTYFGEATLPAPLKVELLPYTALVKVPMGWVGVEGSAAMTPGQIAITELNPRPAVVGGEWLEVANFTPAAFDLNGWTMDLGGGLTHAISTSVVIPPNGRIVIAQAADLGDPQAAVTPAYTYGAASPAFVMPDGAGALSLNFAGTPYARIVWDAVTLPDAGIAVRADPPHPAGVYAGGAQQAICSGLGGSSYGDAGQLGTPGTANPPCFTYAFAPLAMGGFEPIAADGGTLIIAGDAGTTATDDKVYPVTLTAPVKYFGQSFGTLYVGTNGFITTTSTTSAATTNKTVPATTAPVGSIAPFWDDLNASPNTPGSGIYFVRRDPNGTPASGDEYTIVSWEGWKVDAAAAGQVINFQVKFFDNGNLEYHYGAMTPVAGDTTHQGSSATAWLEDPLGKSGLAITVNAPVIGPNSGYRYSYAP